MDHNNYVVIPGLDPFNGNSSWVESMNEDKLLSVSIVLRGNPDGPERTEQIEKQSELFPADRVYLTRKKLMEIHGTSMDDYLKVKEFILNHGFEITSVNLARRRVDIKGSIGRINRAFRITIGIFAFRNLIYQSYLGDISAPEGIAAIIVGVYGLDSDVDSFAIPHNHEKISYKDIKKDHTIISTNARYSTRLISEIYNFPESSTGKGQSVGILQFGGGYKKEDLVFFFEKVEKTKIPFIQDILISEAKNSPGDNYMHDMESILNIEIIGSLAPDSRIHVYFAPNSEIGLIDALSEAIFNEEQGNTVITFSWGLPEKLWKKSTLTIINALFKAAALLGITICVPSGNKGATDGLEDGSLNVDFPASSPYVLACGGTKLYIEKNSRVDEVVWKEINPLDNQFWASGGGISTVFPVPFYQRHINKLNNLHSVYGKEGRSLPDVAAMAGTPGYDTYMNKKPTAVGGGATSAAAPLWAALIARINEKLPASAGFLNPLLYMKVSGKSLFFEVINGDNIISDSGGFSACEGWNACTGWGSPNGMQLLLFLLKI